MTGNREPRDVEARLRASLRAYADAVDDEPVMSPTRAGGSRRASGLRGWRTSVLAAAAVLAVAGGTWVVLDAANDPAQIAASGGGEEAAVPDGDARAESGPESSAATPPPSAFDSSAEAAAGTAAADGALGVPSPAEEGVAYAFDLYTHCGVLGADVGGIWFAADPPLVDGPGSPPPGWDDPYQRGTLTLESADEAVFRDDAGHEVRLRAAESERPPPCA